MGRRRQKRAWIATERERMRWVAGWTSGKRDKWAYEAWVNSGEARRLATKTAPGSLGEG